MRPLRSTWTVPRPFHAFRSSDLGEKAVQSCLDVGDPAGAASGAMNIAEEYSFTGQTQEVYRWGKRAKVLGEEALDQARAMPNNTEEEQQARTDAMDRAESKITDALQYMGWGLRLQGKPAEGLALFEQSVERMGEPLTDVWGLWHARTLHDAHGSSEKDRVEFMAGEICRAVEDGVRSGPWAQSQVLLGERIEKGHEPRSREERMRLAEKHYDQAVDMVRSTSINHVKAEVLAARADFRLRSGNAAGALEDIKEASTLFDMQQCLNLAANLEMTRAKALMVSGHPQHAMNTLSALERFCKQQGAQATTLAEVHTVMQQMRSNVHG